MNLCKLYEFSPNLVHVCALILWRSALKLLIGEFHPFLRVICQQQLHIYTPGIQSMQWRYIVFVFSVCLSVSQSVSQSVSLSVNIYFVSKISQELLFLET